MVIKKSMRGLVAKLRPTEEVTHRLYGSLWVEFDPNLYRQAMDLLCARFRANGLDQAWFQDKRCLDAGCGAGRATLLMGLLGAQQAVGLDIGSTGLRVGRKMAATLGLKNVIFRRGSVLKLPFPADSFDFVFSNGVLHHTAGPDRGLTESFRVLKPGGHLWLYLYGAGGLHWMVVDAVRRLLKPVPHGEANHLLKLYQCPANKRFILMDHWYVPILERYTSVEVEAWLRWRGFTAIRRLRGGVSYDTEERAQSHVTMERAIYGEGDLRYLAAKPAADGTNRERVPQQLVPVLPGQYRGIPRVWRTLDALVRTIERIGPDNGGTVRVLVAMRLHLLTLALLEQKSFDLSRFLEEVGELREVASGFVSSRKQCTAVKKKR